jgi:plastocyanin
MSSGSFSHTFMTAGSFPYFCLVHGSAMTGMVVVNP